MNNDEIRARFASMEAMTNLQPFIEFLRSAVAAVEAEGFTRDQATAIVSNLFTRSMGQQ